MPFGPTPPAYRPSQRPPGARQLNAPLGVLARLANLRGIGTSWTPGGVLIQGPGIPWRFAQTVESTSPGVGIPAASQSGEFYAALVNSASIVVDEAGVAATIAADDPGNDQFWCFNLSQQPVAYPANIIAAWIEGIWLCVWEDCPASG